MTTSLANRYLIVNADDFGLCPEINEGIARAYDDGIVTSTSLMVRWPAAAAAAAMARSRPGLSVGLHLDLGEWEPALDGTWLHRWEVVDIDDSEAVAVEVDRQISVFCELTGSLPTHLDGHQHIQRDGAPKAAVDRVAGDLGLPVRLHDPRVRYSGEFYGQAHRGEPFVEGISVSNLVRVISTLPVGWTELGCHPGIKVPPSLTSYASERDLELHALCSAHVVEALAEHAVTLMSFADLATADLETGLERIQMLAGCQSDVHPVFRRGH